MKSTKIICTIGPSSHSYDTLVEMAKAGMDVVRMNFSHGSYEFHTETIRLIRKVAVDVKKPIAVLMDLQGPKIRTGKLKKETVTLNKGEQLCLTTKDVEGDWNIISVNYSLLPKEAEINERILLDDGNIELKVIATSENEIQCEIVNGGIIRSARGVNLPDTCISIPSITEKDVQDLNFGLEQGVDFVALSFVRWGSDIDDLRKLIAEMERKTPIIAKIEKPEAIKNLTEIIEKADGIMVARGDLGAETSPQEVPILQKQIIRNCNLVGKPVITATQMLESMINKPRPTRAEANDVANAVFDGTDAVMLSGETAIGEYPVQTVNVMANIVKHAENEMQKREANRNLIALKKSANISKSICFTAGLLTQSLNPKCIIGFTLSGRTATQLSQFRPTVPIIAMSPDQKVLLQLALYWGVHGLLIDEADTAEELIDQAEVILLQEGMCRENDVVIMIGGVPVMSKVDTNMIKVHKIKIGDSNL